MEMSRDINQKQKRPPYLDMSHDNDQKKSV